MFNPTHFSSEKVPFEQVPTFGLETFQQKLLNNVLEKAPQILKIDGLKIIDALKNLTNQKLIKDAFTAPLPGSPPMIDDDIDDLPPLVKGMTMREILILGTIATILKKTDVLEAACHQSNKLETGSFQELVAVDSNRHLHVQKFGSYAPNRPCVILEAGGGSGGDSWGQVKDLLKDSAYGLSYDRAGLWLFSDSGSQPGSISQTMKDFEAMLTQLEEKGAIKSPYVLVGHSLGGVFMQLYAAMHPEKVAGLVLVDSSSDTVGEDPRMAPTFACPPAQDFLAIETFMPRSTAEVLFPRARHTLTAHAEAVHKKESLSVLGERIKKRSQPFFGNIPLRVITKRQNE